MALLGGTCMTNGWGSWLFEGGMLKKKLVFKGTVSGPRMTTRFGPFELHLQGDFKCDSGYVKKSCSQHLSFCSRPRVGSSKELKPMVM